VNYESAQERGMTYLSESGLVSLFTFDLLIALPKYDAPKMVIALKIAVGAFIDYNSVFRTSFYMVLLFLY
jgi:hypothetical protein